MTTMHPHPKFVETWIQLELKLKTSMQIWDPKQWMNHRIRIFTDLHKCISFILDAIPNVDKSDLCILVAGALGGRFDHEIGNINVLCKFSDTRIVLISDDCLIQLLPSNHRHEINILSSLEGPHCGLIPIATASAKATISGLQWDLDDTEMKFGGLISTSNIVRKEKITVQSDSDLLWTISIQKPNRRLPPPLYA
ncbi:hypothetical protein MKX01_033525 [Papaver californicum]|nr:hypothetical protein MKX01_033525 [Papaver californicum]